MASGWSNREEDWQEEVAPKVDRHRKQVAAKGKRSHRDAQPDLLERRRHRWRRQVERERGGETDPDGDLEPLDKDLEGEELLDEDEPLDFEKEHRFERGEAWSSDDDLTDYDVDFGEDDWE